MHEGIKGGVAGPNKMQQYGSRLKNGKNLGHNLTITRLFSLPKTFMDNYGVLYCKVHTLRLY